jgi:hypothetical protein
VSTLLILVMLQQTVLARGRIELLAWAKGFFQSSMKLENAGNEIGRCILDTLCHRSGNDGMKVFLHRTTRKVSTLRSFRCRNVESMQLAHLYFALTTARAPCAKPPWKDHPGSCTTSAGMRSTVGGVGGKSFANLMNACEPGRAAYTNG